MIVTVETTTGGRDCSLPGNQIIVLDVGEHIFQNLRVRISGISEMKKIPLS